MIDKLKSYRQYLIYIGILILGIGLGGQFFGNSYSLYNDDTDQAVDQTTHYTCSMHPQIDLQEKGKCPLCGMELIPASNTYALSENEFRMKEEALALADVRTMKILSPVSRRNFLRLSGIITPNVKTNAVQTTLFDGRIESLEVRAVGEYIREGQQIGSIYSPELYMAQDKLLTSASYKDSHEKLFNAARNSLGMWKLTDDQIDTILSTGKPMMTFPLFADVSGTVTEIIASEGNYYKQGDPLFKLSKLGVVWAVFDAYESQLSFLKVGQSIKIYSNAIIEKEIKGKIDFIEPVLDMEKRTVAVRVVLRNQEGLLKPGMFVEGTVEISENPEMITIPKSAVLWTGKRSIVYKRKQTHQPVFEMVEITLGRALDEAYEVLDGLQFGDDIVVNGTFTVDAAAQLSHSKSMMNSDDKATVYLSDKEKLPVELDSGLKQRFAELVTAYVQLKDALVASDSINGLQLTPKLMAIAQTIAEGPLETKWRVHILKIIDLSRELLQSKELEDQRRHFKPLSSEMMELEPLLRSVEDPLYIQYCPMADDNKGGYWLSWDREILNPYYGDKMLHCGEVKGMIE